jgi:TonB family protein
MSLVVHLALASGVVFLAVRNWAHEEAEREAEIDRQRQAGLDLTLDLPGVTDGTLDSNATVDPRGDAPTASGGSTIARVDDGDLGHGGDNAAAVKAIHLTDRDEGILLSPDLISRLDRSQQHRIKSSSIRTSWEDRRSTTHPMEATFIAMGKGDRQERRVVAQTDPSRGAMQALAPSTIGGNPGTLPTFAGDDTQGPAADRAVTYSTTAPGSHDDGSLTSSPGLGAHGANAGTDHRSSAAVANARPDVTQGPVAIPAIDKSKPRDDVDSEQEVSTIVRSLVHASTAGGPNGDGRGGTGGGGPTASGGTSGDGSHSKPLGVGDGDLFDLDTNDPRLVPYFRRLHAKIDPLWVNAFPRSAMLELKQGTVIIDFTIDENGTAHVSWPPVRPSGIDEFDRNCAEAIRKAGPFDPIPASLGVKKLHVRAPFTARSTIVD